MKTIVLQGGICDGEAFTMVTDREPEAIDRLAVSAKEVALMLAEQPDATLPVVGYVRTGRELPGGELIYVLEGSKL